MNPDEEYDLHELEAELRRVAVKAEPPAEWRRQVLPHLAAGAVATATVSAVGGKAVTTPLPCSLFPRPLVVALAAAWAVAGALELMMPDDPVQGLPVRVLPSSAPGLGTGPEGDLLTFQNSSNFY